MTTYIYKSTTGKTVVVDDHVVTVNPGLQSAVQIEELDAFIGTSIARYDDGVLATTDNSLSVTANRNTTTGVLESFTAGSEVIPLYKTPIILSSSAVPSGIAPSGKIGTNGALTLGTLPAGSLSFSATSGAGVTVTGTGTTFVAADVGRAIIVEDKICTITAQASPNCTVTITGTLTTTSFANNAWQLTSLMQSTYGPGGVSTGIWLRFPTGALYSGSVAGSYWTVMATQAVGIVYNNRLTLPGSLTPPASPTAISAAGPGAYTGGAGSLASVAGVTIPAGLMGINGAVRLTATLSATSPATSGTKNFTVVHGGSSTNTMTLTTFTTAQECCYTQNRGTAITQVSQRSNLIGFGGSASGTTINSNIDTSQAQPFLLQIQCSTATDYGILEGYTVEVLTLE